MKRQDHFALQKLIFITLITSMRPIVSLKPRLAMYSDNQARLLIYSKLTQRFSTRTHKPATQQLVTMA